MCTLLRSPIVLGAGCLLIVSSMACGQNAFSPGRNEYPIAGALAGDQTAPNAAITTTGGYLVWQDNATDGDGLGIRAQRLDGNFNKSGNAFRVNSIGAGDQEKPQVAVLANGGAVFVWQGGKFGFQKIYARFLPATGTNFSSADIRVNTYTNDFQIDPRVTVLADGSVVVVWSSYGQDGSLQGIFGQRFTSAGAKSGAEFQVNQYSQNNQRTPVVAALADGGFVVSWVSELQRGSSTVDIYARLFNSSGVAIGSEFPVNTVLTSICANPSLAATPDGGFAVGWSQRNIVSGNSSSSQFWAAGGVVPVNSWDVFVRTYGSGGVATGEPVRMNTCTSGAQYAPKLSSFLGNYLSVWLSLGQDGSQEGIYGQFLTSSGELAGVEFRVNGGNAVRQTDPVVCSDNASRFLVVWSSFANSGDFDLFAREYDLIQVSITPLAQGVRISWNTKPGLVYQVQSSVNYTTWTNYGVPRTATALGDYIDVTGGAGAILYRVVRIQ
jgi:hypothetical protein